MSRAMLVGVVLSTVALAASTAGSVDGTLDPAFDSDGLAVISFDVGGNLADIGRSVLVLPDGAILVVGTVAIAGPSQAAGIARLLPDGSLDTSWGSGGRVVVPSSCLTVDDAVLRPAGGLDLAVTLCSGQACVLRLDAAAAPDTLFGTGGFACMYTGTSGVTTLPDSDGSVVLVGNYPTSSSVTLFRFDTRGSLVASGGSGFGVSEVLANAAALDAARNVVVVGQLADGAAWGRDILVLRYTPGLVADTTFGDNGVLFTGFDLGGSNDDRGLAVTTTPHGDVLVGGVADTAAGHDALVLRLDPAGTNPAVLTFGFRADGIDDDQVEDLVLQPDGRLLAAGTVAFDSVSDEDLGVGRLLVPGNGESWALDTSFINGGRRWVGFDLGGGHVDRGHAVAFVPGGVLAAGEAEDSGVDAEFAVARLAVGLLFADAFESAGTGQWSASAP